MNTFDKFKQDTQRKIIYDWMSGRVNNIEILASQEVDLGVIWLEWAIYNIRFERGVMTWRKYLKRSGYVAAKKTPDLVAISQPK